ncbi:oligosaccharyl transferase glycoprotein complex, beta subunit [Coemansia sp. RSA 1813]|nr:oligosaccharyl transferase glycoprotein complex, beta subunit [Coemansia sp. RSA 1646]KAJ1772851.1 oligosaccharyl transferase glycoprotein complex, beta subunit [Coemansia sp. RSA 1843]KAJ2088885.1 oligosaccharyl transferase glycoprotein complex, beta subunit [Coemansia sp. RSA 986]KAJ2213964.1 oligosaccharyl transferase glycoprotein complex, beta subunit [Coemansia sp. RSA 487]KAJ2568728.1 oligosaccharyl transferase glycoprotein complex, beta subunit [Coemansia sp. RSA 1813]
MAMRTLALCVCAALLGVLVGLADAKSATGSRVLVLVPKPESLNKYSHVLETLAQRGFDVTATQATNASAALHNDGVRTYDHAMLLSPGSKSFGAGLTIREFIRFVDDGGNLVLAASPEASEFHRKLAAQFGVDFEKPGTLAIDHVANLKDGDAGDHTIVASSRFARAPAVLSPRFVQSSNPDPVYFKGIAHRYSGSPLLVPLLTASRTTYSGKKDASGEASVSSGKSLGLVSVFQTRSNARVAVTGGVTLFSDALIQRAGDGNRQFVDDILQWTFQEKAVLRETAHRHYLAATGERPEHYRINNEIVYEVDLSVYHDDAWHAYAADDVQFEATMLDPYIRATLNRTRAADPTATYRGDIRLPDRYGTFTFRVNYKRTGFSNVDVADTVGIWPLRHDEYPRFLLAAYPYYAGSLVMVVGFLMLCMAWLWSAEPSKAKKAKTE